MARLNVLVVGECGDGKSTMINALRDVYQSQPAQSGLDPRGVTKEITMYPAAEYPEYRGDGSKLPKLFLIDTPGIGDHDISIAAFMTLLETFLAPGMVPGGIHGILVTCPVPKCRIQLGQQLLQQLIELGFQAPGRDKYETWRNLQGRCIFLMKREFVSLLMMKRS